MVAMNGGRLQNVKMQSAFQKLSFCCLLMVSGKNLKVKALPLYLLCLTGFVFAQKGTGLPASPTKVSTPAETPILIIHNLCPPSPPPKSKQGCEQVVTRADFDSLITALDPKMPESNRLALATEYVRLRAMASEAERL